MTNHDIYQAALALLSESLDDSHNIDFEERAPYLLAAFICEVKDLDNALRRFAGETTPPAYNAVFADLNQDFPLLERFCASAALYTASMLIIDEDSVLSDKLYERYCDAISSLTEYICGQSEKIKDKYFAKG